MSLKFFRYFLSQNLNRHHHHHHHLYLNNLKRTLAILPPKIKDGEESPGVNTKELIRIKDYFNEEGLKTNFNSKHFIETVDDFQNLRKLKRFGYSEFIAAALPAMKEFGVEKDIESYKALMKIFPKGAFHPSSKFTAGYYPHFVQQQAALNILLQMEENQVMPDRELEDHIIDAFSQLSLVWQRCGRMIYWMTKFKNANPYPYPEKMSKDPLELAIVALRRMTIYIDPQTEIYVYRTSQIDESAEDTWICFAQSDSQCKLIENLDFEKYRVSIDGPFNVWVLENPISYFVLYARESRPKEIDPVEEFLKSDHEINDVSDIPLSNFGNLSLQEAIDPMLMKHQQEDGTILSVVATGTSNQESLRVWLKKLEQHNPRLSSIPIVIAPHEDIMSTSSSSTTSTTTSSDNFQKEYSYDLHNKKQDNIESDQNVDTNQDNKSNNNNDDNKLK